MERFRLPPAGGWLLVALLLAACAPSSSTPAPSSATVGPASSTTGPAAGAAAPAAVEPLPIRIGYAAVSAGFVPLWLAQEVGLYEKYGLRAELINLGPRGVTPMIAGEVDVVQVAGPSVFAAALQGADTLWMLVTINRPVLRLVVRPEIDRVESLRNQAVGITGRGTYVAQWMDFALRRYGLEPDRDVTVLTTGGLVESVAAVSTGRVAATLIPPPFHLRALDLGLKELLDLSTFDSPYPAAGVATTRRALREQSELLRRFARAYVEAIHLYRTDAALSQDLISRYTMTTAPEELAESYRAYRDLTEAVPLPRLEAMQTALELMAPELPHARDADPRTFYDDSLVRELEASGFIAALGR
jgi:ABC-type nitrate/sulfonate/bicarbonate transport system substrate-binding protein